MVVLPGYYCCQIIVAKVVLPRSVTNVNVARVLQMHIIS